MRVLITGGAGFIGSHLVEHFQGRAEVTLLATGFRNVCSLEQDLAENLAFFSQAEIHPGL